MLTVARRLRVPVVRVRIPAVRQKIMHNIEWRKIKGKGRGVFALKDFEKGEMIEECPVILLSDKEVALCEQTILDDYVYAWKSDEDGAIALGYGSLYNHSPKPNVEYDLMYKDKTIVYKAIESIKNGEEILLDYNWDSKEATVKKWFRPSA